MASDGSMVFISSTQEDDYDDTDDGFYHQNQLPHSLSRLSMCTSSMYTNEDEDYNEERMRMSMSRLSIESFDGDADEEFSDDKEFKGLGELSSDSEKEPQFYSLPATLPSRRSGSSIGQQLVSVKDCASENEVEKGMSKQKMRRNLRRRKIIREKRADRKFNKKDEEENVMNNNYGNNSLSGESEGAGSCGGGGLVIITRPKGGRRSLCMDMEEMKACRDLGFELEHERMLEITSRVSLSASTLDTSSGGNSPIAHWHISSPGDAPRDVKARLKVWARAVALASASGHPT